MNSIIISNFVNFTMKRNDEARMCVEKRFVGKIVTDGGFFDPYRGGRRVLLVQ
ncbi:MAG: hypothetical protein GY868_18840 [Deltaproteobacteria bacterium]|nr:hypothetical protein [Deltaproteobacteria bacterium]